MRRCPHQDGNRCQIADYLSPDALTLSRRTCSECEQQDNPRNLNPVTLALAQIPETNEGPGTNLMNTIGWFVRKPPNCPCPDRVQVMNAWGPDRCEREIKTIVNWLKDSAQKNGLPFHAGVIRAVVLRAIRQARQGG